MLFDKFSKKPHRNNGNEINSLNFSNPEIFKYLLRLRIMSELAFKSNRLFVNITAYAHISI